VASTATETGLPARAVSNAPQFPAAISVNLEIL